MKAATRNWVARWGWLVWGAVILVVSVVPVAWVFGLAPESAWAQSGTVGHAFEFGLLAVLVTAATARARDDREPTEGFLAGAVAGLAYGAAIELIQAPIPYRSADPRDFALDALGVVLALALLWYGRRRAQARRVAPAAAGSDLRGGGR